MLPVALVQSRSLPSPECLRSRRRRRPRVERRAESSAESGSQLYRPDRRNIRRCRLPACLTVMRFVFFVALM